MGTMKVIGSALYQWELGRKLRITPAPGATVVDVQFAHPGDTEALSVTPKEENGILTVDIPNILLQSGQEIVAFLVNASSDKVETTSHKVFHVVNRPKPADYAYEETEVTSWRALEARVLEFMDEINEARVNGDLKGEPGKDGYTPIKGVDYFDGKDGYTPQKGVDYFDGKNGEDGYTPVKGKDYFDGKDGEPGKDYVLTQSDKEEIAEMASELVDVPEGGGGGGGAQADWNAADGQPGHVLNRTHWVENGRTEVLPELVFTSYSGNGTSLKEPIGLTAGKTYIVNWNGVEYKCTAFSVPLGDGSAANWTATALGDWNSINNNTEPVTGEPFGIFEYTQPELIETFGKALYIKPREDTIHDCTVSIYEETQTIHKLDGKYLPDGVPYVIDGYSAILPDYTIESDSDIYAIPHLGLVSGNTYTIKIAGVAEYKCVASTVTVEGITGVAMGNIAAYSGAGDTGEPFVLFEIPTEYVEFVGFNVIIIGVNGGLQLPATFSILGSTQEIRKLDNDCLDLAWLPTEEDTIVVEETTVEHGQPLDGIGFNDYKVGAKLAVRIDGVRYPVTITSAGSGIDAFFYIGDPSFVTVPFFANIMATQAWFNFADGRPHAVSVYTVKVNQMPEEFLPSTALYIGKELTEEQKAQVRNNIGAAAEKVKSVPDYITTEINAVAKTLGAVQEANPKSATFAFLTDHHFHYNSEHLVRHNLHAIDEISKKCRVEFAAYGGDNIAESCQPHAYALSMLKYFGNILKEYDTRTLTVKGNHDDNTLSGYIANVGYPVDYALTDGEFYNALHRHNENVFNIQMDENRDKLYFYVDLPSQQIRVIFLNVIDIPIIDDGTGQLVYKGSRDHGYSNEQLNWVVSDALDFSDKKHPEQWGVITVQHFPDCPNITDFCSTSVAQEHGGAAMYGIFHAFRWRGQYSSTVTDGDFPHDVSCDFSEAKAELICRISGHTHADRHAEHDGILYVSTQAAGTNGVGTSQSSDGNTYSKVADSAEESSFDFFTINKTDHKIYATRFGAGVDREFTWPDMFNLFTYGGAEDWVNTDGAAAGVTVGSNYVERADAGGGSGYAYKNTMYTNTGKTFRIRAKAHPSKNKDIGSSCGFLIKRYDADGNVLTGGFNGGPAGWMTYVEYYKGSLLLNPRNFGEGVLDVEGQVSATELDAKFTLPENVASFQIGFIFKSTSGAPSGQKHQIYDIYFTEE